MKRLSRNVYNQKSVQLEFDNATQPQKPHYESVQFTVLFGKLNTKIWLHQLS